LFVVKTQIRHGRRKYRSVGLHCEKICDMVTVKGLNVSFFGLGVGRNGFFCIHFHSYLYSVLNFASFSEEELATMGLDLVSFTVLDFGLAAVVLDLVSFLYMYSKTSS
jgi:hypothetical protein